MKTTDQIYKDLLGDILVNGVESRPRNLLTKELLGKQVVINCEEPIILNKLRKPNYAFMVAEWLWILFGRDDVGWISAFNSKISQYSDDGKTFFGAYGPRFNSQLQGIYEKLKQDPDSRQAVISIWRESPPQTKDVPCTVSLHFVVRQKKLHCFAHMRSQDAWLGFPYDIFNFSQLTNLMAGLLNVQAGKLFLTVDCLHLYQPNFTEASASRSFVGDAKRLQLKPIMLEMNQFRNLVDQFKDVSDRMIKRSIEDHELDETFPTGISEHLVFLNRYLEKDGSHKQCEFWKGAY